MITMSSTAWYSAPAWLARAARSSRVTVSSLLRVMRDCARPLAFRIDASSVAMPSVTSATTLSLCAIMAARSSDNPANFRPRCAP